MFTMDFRFNWINWRIGDRVTCDRKAHEIQLKENCCTDSRIRRLENGGKSSFSSRYVMPALCCPSQVQNRLMNLKWPCEFFMRPAKNDGLTAPSRRVAGTRSRQFRRAAKEQPSSHKNANFRTVLHERAGARFSPVGYFFAGALPRSFFLAESISAHAITVRQVLFDGAPISGKFTFNDRPPTGITWKFNLRMRTSHKIGNSSRQRRKGIIFTTR